MFGPAFAIERRYGSVCFSLKFSSLNFSPYIDFPPVPFLAVKSPPYAIKSLMTRWKGDPLYPNPFSPVHNALKFSAHIGVTSLYNSKMILPANFPAIFISKKQIGFPAFGWGCY